jgi:hypothetical protein
MIRILSIAAAAALGAALPASAQEAAPANRSCELHVWPAEDFHTVYYGWGHGGTVDGGFKQRTGYARLWVDPLAMKRQAEILSAQPIPDLLGLLDYRMVVHPQRLSSQVIRTSPGRLVPDTPPCYAELVVDTVVLQHNVLHGKGLNVIYRFRQFGAAPAPERTFGTFVVAPVNLVLSDKELPEPTAFAAEMERAYVATIGEFATRLQAPPKKAKRKP